MWKNSDSQVLPYLATKRNAVGQAIVQLAMEQQALLQLVTSWQRKDKLYCNWQQREKTI